MLTFIKLDATHILYGDIMFEHKDVEYIHIFGLNSNSVRVIADKDGSTWLGLCVMSVNLPRQKTDE